MPWDTLDPPAPEHAGRYYRAGWWRGATFLDDLARWAATRADHPAIIGYENGALARTVTYAELSALVERFAGALAELGVGHGDAVVQYLPNRWMLAPLYLACARLGAVAAPGQRLMGGREIRHVLTASRAKVCVTVDQFGGVDYAARLAEVAPPTLKHRVVIGDATPTGAIDFTEFFERTHWEDSGRAAPGQAGADDPFLLVYTSGTTGAPKAVVHSQNTIYAAARSLSEPFGLTGADVISIPQSLTHVAGAMHAVFAPIMLGGTCVMHDTNTDMGLLLDATAAHGITYIHAAPAYLADLLAEQRAQPRRTASLRVISSSSAPIPAQMVADIREVFGLPLRAIWGMTETGGCTTTRPEDGDDWALYSDGRPMPWMEARVDAGPGEQTGRLLVRGASLCLGYVRQRDLWLASLDSAGWFDTGDLASEDGRGGIRMRGRQADLITRSTGAKIPAAEIEDLLARHPSVAEAAMIGYPDPAMSGSELACAFIVANGVPPSLADLRAHLMSESVAPPWLPDRMELIAALPRNALGKLIREELRQRLHESADVG